MKTKPVFWYENFARLCLVMLAMFVIAFLISSAFFRLLVEGGEFWTKVVNSIFGPVNFWAFYSASISFAMTIICGPLLWAAQFKIRLFDYERKNKLVPFINNLAVAVVSKKDIDKLDWQENKVFKSTFEIGDRCTTHAFWATDGKGLYIIPNWVLVENADKIKDGTIEGTWTWSYSDHNLVYLIPAKDE